MGCFANRRMRCYVHPLRAPFVAFYLALAAMAGCTGGSGNPAAPAGGAGATIAGTVSRSTGPLGLTVAVVGTDLSAVVDEFGLLSDRPRAFRQLFS